MRNDLRHTANWTDAHTPLWNEVLSHLKAKPFAFMAEIGCYEGRSSRWFAENILTGPGSALVCIDPWGSHAPEIEAHFDHNLSDLLPTRKVIKMRGTSRQLASSILAFDAIYIDGDHRTEQVLIDACNAWQALTPGGVLIFDDYKLYQLNNLIDVRSGVQAFIDCMEINRPRLLSDKGDYGQCVMWKP